MSIHHFDTDHANTYGVVEAVIISNLKFWIEKNLTTNHNIRDGKCWSWNSAEGFREHFTYLAVHQIRYALDKLVKMGVLEKGNWNKNTFDKKSWYTFVEPEKFISKNFLDFFEQNSQSIEQNPQSIEQNPQMGVTKSSDLICNTDNKHTDNKLIKKINTKKRTTKLSLVDWESKNGKLDTVHFKEWGIKHDLCANMVYKAIESFRDDVVAGGYLYADFPAAFRKWHRDKLQELRKPKPTRML